MPKPNYEKCGAQSPADNRGFVHPCDRKIGHVGEHVAMRAVPIRWRDVPLVPDPMGERAKGSGNRAVPGRLN